MFSLTGKKPLSETESANFIFPNFILILSLPLSVGYNSSYMHNHICNFKIGAIKS